GPLRVPRRVEPRLAPVPASRRAATLLHPRGDDADRGAEQAMTPRFEPLTAESYRRVTRRAPERSMLGFVMTDAGFMPLCVVAVYDDGDRYVLFSEWTKYFRKRATTFGGRRAVVMGAQKATETLLKLDKPVDAVASAKYQGTALLLERM